MATKKIYMATLDRFGYELTVIAKTEKEAIDALMEEYVRAYKVRNGYDPREDIAYEYGGDRSYYEVAKGDIGIYDFELGKVEWI